MTAPQSSSPDTIAALADKIDDADVMYVRSCPMFTKFDHENVDTLLSGEEQNLIVAALRASQPATPTGGDAIQEAQKRYPDDADDYGHPESLKHLRDAFMAGASFEKDTSARSSAGSGDAITDWVGKRLSDAVAAARRPAPDAWRTSVGGECLYTRHQLQADAWTRAGYDVTPLYTFDVAQGALKPPIEEGK